MHIKTIYADPPWEQKGGPPIGKYKTDKRGNQIWNCANTSSQDLPYSIMLLTKIINLPVKELVAEDAHLYIWVTNKFMPFVFQVISAWGFKYSTTLVWAKNTMGSGLGGSYGVSTEFLIFATRGHLGIKQKQRGTWFNIKRPYVNGFPCHSKKPYFFYEMIEKVSPGPYLELFAREKRKNWQSHGNELQNSFCLKCGGECFLGCNYKNYYHE